MELLNKELIVGERRILSGKYIAHWEVPRFQCVLTKKLFFGLRHKIEFRSRLELEEGVVWPDCLLRRKLSRGPADFYDMQIDCTVIEKGHFGHKGWMKWRLLVHKFLHCEERT